MARQKMDFAVRIEGLAQLDMSDAAVMRAQRRYLDRSSERLRESMSKATPSKSGAMRRAWVTAVDAPYRFALINTHPGAKARDRGALIEPKARTVLRFRGADGWVYTAKPIKQHATRFTRKGLSPRRRILTQEFAEAMAELNGGGPA